jgi:hypothetical protein
MLWGSFVTARFKSSNIVSFSRSDGLTQLGEYSENAALFGATNTMLLVRTASGTAMGITSSLPGGLLFTVSVNSWQNRELYFSVSGDKMSVLSCSENEECSRSK